MASQIKPLKKFGQNFLKSDYFAEKIVDSLNCEKNDLIVEIGPGKGALTQLLIKKKPKNLSVIEIDRRLANLLAEKFPSDLNIIVDNILNVSFDQLAPENKIKVVGNIPYNITSDIIYKLIENNIYIERAVLMIQKEVANRLVAKTKSKDYGLVTIFVGFHSEVRKLFDVNRENFYPVPNVDSSVVCLDFKSLQENYFDYELFRKIVKTGFNARRKKLRNTLKNLLISYDINTISSISLEKRPEELSIEEFKSLTNEISNKRI